MQAEMGKKGMVRRFSFTIGENEKGVILIGLLIYIFFIGLIILSLLKLLTAEAISQVLDINKKRAFYAAQSGIEYAMRGINEHAVHNSTLLGLNNYHEDIDTGPGTHCKITIRLNGPDYFEIIALGYSKNYVQKIVKKVHYIDVAKYAVYATGRVRYVRTIPWGKIYQHARYMPVFDKDELIEMAKPGHYYPHDLKIKSIFSFTTDLVYVGRDLTFGIYNWINIGNFAVGRNVRIKSSFGIFGVTSGVFYQFNPGSRFLCEWQFIWRSLFGGLVVNGDVYGTNIPWLPFRYTVYYNRNTITRFLRHSVNGGPLVYTKTQWLNQ